MQLEDIIGGQYYAAHYENEVHPTIVLANKDGMLKGAGIRPNSHVLSNPLFINNNSWGCKNNIRLATLKEIHWLDCCINHNDFISYEHAMLTFVDSINYQQDSEYNNILIKLLTQ